MINKDISILVVTHNHGDLINKLLSSLEKFNYKNVYICDAASTDNTVDVLKSSSFHLQTLYKDTLEGFSKNNNDLIRHFNLNTKYYLLLNPDLYFEEDFIQELYAKMESDRTIGITTPIINYPTGEIQVTWKQFPSVLHVIKKRLGIITAKDEKQLNNEEIDWCLGACMLISNRLLKPHNQLLDERYRLYCEDVDICFEAKTKNLKVIGVDKVKAYHHLNELSAKNIFSKYNWWNIQSIIKFALKWNFKYIFK
ncbi:glycosyltransferase [Faecalibacter sp. LW9]|uniref:glycosyltransferase n=1 Tax=Faecalibacter sp. LW9 TaxID=3103144 RepID=UPI002AFDF380|nr:glycosyltransferase [Faecalibacter sp. LW9]